MLINSYVRKIIAGAPNDGMFSLLAFPAGDGNGNFDLALALAPSGTALAEDTSNFLLDESGTVLTDEYGRALVADV